MLSPHNRKLSWELRTKPVSDVDGVARIPPSFLSDFPNPLSRIGEWVKLLRGQTDSTPAPNRPMMEPMSLPFRGDAQVLLIVPPFASVWYPSLAAEILAACVRQAGYGVDVLYANLLLAGFLGTIPYEQIGIEQTASLAGERFFARAAFGLPALGRNADLMFDPNHQFGEAWHDIRGEMYRDLYPDGPSVARIADTKRVAVGRQASVTFESLCRLEAESTVWVDRVAAAIAERGYRIVGSTTTFQQTTASIALLNGVKSINPETVTVLGGANCEGEMAEGMLSLRSKVDYVFSGESEEVFPEFVRSVLAGRRPAQRIISGRPCSDMDRLPSLSYRGFFDQRQRLDNPAPASSAYLTFETSRGCWWGQKQHCTFCGLNGEGMGFRYKSADRVIDELRKMVSENPTRKITMTDNIMPREYFKTLLPRLRDELPGLSIFYEQKSNLSLADMIALIEGGVTSIQPGIEALSAKLLKLMRKGVDARQNLMLLRYGRITGVRLIWNLLCGFPGDRVEYYRETLELVPLIVHLQPPSGLWHLSIDRFSPYFFDPSAHDVKNLRPLPVYRDIFPEWTDLHKIAYHFLGDYRCDTHQEIGFVQQLSVAVRRWGMEWHKPYGDRPELKLCQHGDRFVLLDTRGLPGTHMMRYVDVSEARLLMSAGIWRNSPEEQQAVDAKLAVHVDNWFVPLPVASLELFLKLSAEHLKAAARTPAKRQPELAQLAVFQETSLGSCQPVQSQEV